MAHLILRPEWYLDDHGVTPEQSFLNRRHFLRQMGVAGTTLLALGVAGCSRADDAKGPSIKASGAFPAKRNPEFNPGWRLTNEKVAATYNNFYEFSTDKAEVSVLATRLVTSPWPIQISGLIDQPMTPDARELMEMFPLEERVYRFRCVEAWA